MLKRSALGLWLVCSAACGTPIRVDGGGDAADAGPDGGPMDACAAMADEPDPTGADTNCDGVDGALARAVFVAPDGDDVAPGTRERPVRTLARAVELAGMSNRYVLAAAGTYAEPLAVRQGVSVHGGYDRAARFGARRVRESRAAPPAGSALVADGVTSQRTVVSGFTFAAAAGAAPGASSVAARLRAAPMLELADDAFEAGAGAGGAVGSPGADGTPGMPGLQGNRGVMCRARGPCAPPYLFPAESPPPPGEGGRGCMIGRMGGVDVFASGGTGGAAGYPGHYPPISPHQDGLAGEFGACAPLGCVAFAPGGAGGATTEEPTPARGGTVGGGGAAGADGGSGAPATRGSFAFEGFIAGDGGNGSSGVTGGGGAGGGGGGGLLEARGSPTEVLYFGAAGSGGGGGGCGGGGGRGGGGGGASVGLLVVGAAPRLARVTIRTASGGVGAAGGAGGAGGTGGAGGLASTAWTEGGVPRGAGGGPGGAGGVGGVGGRGGGGAGGPSLGVVLLEGAVFERGDTVVTVGTGGTGADGAGAGASAESAAF